MPKARMSTRQILQYGVIATVIGGGLYLNIVGEDGAASQETNEAPSADTKNANTGTDTGQPESNRAEGERNILFPMSSSPSSGTTAQAEADTEPRDNSRNEKPRRETLASAYSGNDSNDSRLDPADENVTAFPPPESYALSEGRFPHPFISADDRAAILDEEGTVTLDPAEDENSPDAKLTPAEKLARQRNQLEQQVRRGQIPPSQRQEILRSKDFNQAIAEIGQRVGAQWFYDGDDFSEHGVIVSISLGDDGEPIQVKVRRSSGNDRYNQSAIKATEVSAPFYEITALPLTAQTLLNPFSLTFGSIAAIEAFEATWRPQETDDTPSNDDKGTGTHSVVNRIKRDIQQHWPEDLTPDVDHDVTVQVTLAMPMGHIAAIEFLRPTNSVDTNDRIYRTLRNMPPFKNLQALPLREQNEARQFNLHITPDGRIR